MFAGHASTIHNDIIYIFVVFWGTGIVFFLAKFINLHDANAQGYWVELCQQVETGRF